MQIIPVMAKLYFQHHYSSLQCYMILQKSFYDDLTLKTFSYYYHCWKQLCCFKFFRILCLWIECSIEQQLKCILLGWMLESDWLTNVLRCAIIFRKTHGEHSSRQFSWPHYMTISLHKIISVISMVSQQKINQNWKHYSLSPALGLSLTDTDIVCTHLNISVNVVSATLMILSVT